MVSGAVLHSLPSGYRFDLRNRVLLPSDVDPNRADFRPPGRAGRRLKRIATAVAAEGVDGYASKRRGAVREKEASE